MVKMSGKVVSGASTGPWAATAWNLPRPRVKVCVWRMGVPGVVCRWTRPDQALASQTCVPDATVDGGHPGDFVHNRRRRGVVPSPDAPTCRCSSTISPLLLAEPGIKLRAQCTQDLPVSVRCAR